MTPSERDEYPHVPGPDPFWNESYYFNFFDDAAELGAAMRIGYSPNRGNADGFLCLYLENGELGFVRMNAVSLVASHGRHGQSIEVGALSFSPTRAFESWTLRYDGPVFVSRDGSEFGELMRLACVAMPTRHVTLELTATSIHAPFDFHSSSRRSVAPLGRWVDAVTRPERLVRAGFAIRALRKLPAMRVAEHYEQATRIAGTMSVDGVVRAVRGTGQRDHSWGVRDMRVPSRWRWISFQFGDELCVNATRVEVLTLIVEGGYAYYRDRPCGLRSFSLSNDAARDGSWPAQMRLELGLEGDSISVDVEVLRQLPVAIETDGQGTLVNESLARFTWEGRTTLGIVEAMEQRFP